MRNALATYHPAICFLLLVGAIVLTMVVRHPLYLAASLLLAASCYATTKGAHGFAKLSWMLPLLVLVILGNPVVNPLGNTVLFNYFGGRPYTLEALCYGVATGALVAAMFLWFGSFNAVLTTDKFSYLFRPIAPAASLVLTMVLRMVPSFQKKLHAFAQARECIGMAGEARTKKERVAAGSVLLSQLTSWALEGSQTTADSMQSRGYGLLGRTSYVNYRFASRDAVLGVAMAVLFVGAVVGLIQGAAYVEYIPAIVIPPTNPVTIAGLACFIAFLALPTVVNLSEQIVWRRSLSKI